MNEGFANSQRSTVLRTIFTYLREVNGGRYYVRRGPINWAQHNFDQHRYAVSINCDESSFLRDGPQEMIVSVEMLGKLQSEDELQAGNINDTGIDEFFTDIQIVVGQLVEAKQSGNGGDPSNDNVVLRVDQIHDKVVEMSDTARGLQGIIAFFVIEY